MVRGLLKLKSGGFCWIMTQGEMCGSTLLFGVHAETSYLILHWSISTLFNLLVSSPPHAHLFIPRLNKLYRLKCKNNTWVFIPTRNFLMFLYSPN